MGTIYVDIEVRNARNVALKPMKVKALVDTGASTICIPENIALQLELAPLDQREAKLAHGKIVKAPYVGPVEIRFENRMCFTGAVVIGDEVLLGAVPMEDMDLIISPKHEKVMVNPESPNFPKVLVK